MQYRVYSGPRGAEDVRAADKKNMLFKQFSSLDDAVGWAHHLDTTGHTALLIEGDDGTCLTRREIAAMLRHGEFDRVDPTGKASFNKPS
jgi:hypothetical protein